MAKAFTLSCLFHFALFLIVQSATATYAEYTSGYPDGIVGIVQIYSYLDIDSANASSLSSQTSLADSNVTETSEEIAQDTSPDTNILDSNTSALSTLQNETIKEIPKEEILESAPVEEKIKQDIENIIKNTNENASTNTVTLEKSNSLVAKNDNNSLNTNLNNNLNANASNDFSINSSSNANGNLNNDFSNKLVPFGQGDEFPSFRQYTAPIYPVKARRDGISGLVVLKVYINTKGYAENIQIEQSDHELLTSAAVRSLENSHFHPYRPNGKPVASYTIIPIRFELN